MTSGRPMNYYANPAMNDFSEAGDSRGATMSSRVSSRAALQSTIGSTSDVLPHDHDQELKGCFVTHKRVGIIVLLVVFALIIVAVLAGIIAAEIVRPDALQEAEVPATTLDPSVPYHHVRLPDTLVPLEYELQLKFDIDKTDESGNTVHLFSGSVSITVLCQEQTDLVILHALDLTIDSKKVSVREKDKTADLAISSQFTFDRYQYYVIELKNSLKTGKEYVISFEDFSGPMTNDLKGLYVTSYSYGSASAIAYIAASQFEPTYARRAFPCFDEPQMRANFTVKIVHDTLHTPLLNSEMINVVDTEDNDELTSFETLKRMAPNMLSIALILNGRHSDEWEEVSDSSTSGIKVVVLGRPAIFEELNFLLGRLINSLDQMETFFSGNKPSGITQLNVVAIPEHLDYGNGAWGLMTFLESDVRYLSGLARIDSQMSIFRMVAHRVAQMWFDNCLEVWWSEMWVREAFSRFYESKIIEAYMEDSNEWKSIRASDMELVNNIQKAMELDAYETSVPLSDSFENVEEVDVKFLERYDLLAYKGLGLIRMLEALMGEEVFLSATETFLNDYEETGANFNQIWKVFTNTYENAYPFKRLNVETLMETWTEQKGLPLIVFNRDDDKISLKQKYFLYPENTFDISDTSYNYQWTIPFIYAEENSYPVLYTEWLNKSQVSDTFEPSSSVDNDHWVVGNPGQMAFYRVFYDPDETTSDPNNWENIIAEMTSDTPTTSPAFRAGILNDAFQLQRLGQLSIGSLFELTDYLKGETEYAPWYTAAQGFRYMKDRLAVSSAYKDFQVYIWCLLDASFNFEDLETFVQDESRLLWQFLVAFGLENANSNPLGQEVIDDEALEIYDKWLASSTEPPVDLRKYIFYTGVNQGYSTDWEKIWDELNPDLYPDKAEDLSYALSGSRELWVLERFLNEYLLDDQYIYPGDVGWHIKNIGSHPIGHQIVWDFVMENWSLLNTEYSKQYTFKTLIEGITALANTEKELEQFEALLKEVPAEGFGETAAAEALIRIASNIEWLKNYEDAIKQVLEEMISESKLCI